MTHIFILENKHFSDNNENLQLGNVMYRIKESTRVKIILHKLLQKQIM